MELRPSSGISSSTDDVHLDLLVASALVIGGCDISGQGLTGGNLGSCSRDVDSALILRRLRHVRLNIYYIRILLP